MMKLFLVRRIVTTWCRGIGYCLRPKVAMVVETVLEMVDGEEEEDMARSLKNKPWL